MVTSRPLICSSECQKKQSVEDGLISLLIFFSPPTHSYRQAHKEGGPPGLPGHPELRFTPGVEFSSGRLGHQWPLTNGVAMANPDKITILLGSDGSQQEGNDAEAARLAVAQQLNVKLFIDDNDVTIAGHPSEYFKGFSVEKVSLSVPHETREFS
jgi:transketolase N-terminal domain/subunit